MSKSVAKKAQLMPNWRFAVVAVLLAMLLLLLVWRLLELQVLDVERGHEFLRYQGDVRSIRKEVIPAYRGVITDRHGEPLAVSTPVASVWFNPHHISNDKAQWRRLAEKLQIPYERLAKKITRNRDKQFVYLRRHMAPAAVKEVLELGVAGVYAQREYKRFYPAGEVAAHLVGFTNIDDKGQEGVELSFDHWLQGEAGSKRVLKDLRGNVIRDIEQSKTASPGKDLALSIDLRLQYLVYRELKTAMRRSNAKAASMVILDARTGEVLAMANQPSYNPNNRRQLQVAHTRNRAITDLIEPGSTVKPLTVVAALESGRYQPDTKIDTHPGYIRVGGKTLLDPKNYGQIDVATVLTKSSQVGTSKLALDLDEQAVWDVFQRFGLGTSTGTGFPGERAGLLPGRVDWKPIERVNFAFGYGLSVTPLQIAQAYGVLANKGVKQPVSLLRVENESEGEAVIAPEVAKQLLAMLKTVTEKGGTGTQAQLESYSAAGKTGTVHKLSKIGYADDRYLALFAGMAPAKDPRLVAVVVIDEPRSGKYYGGEAAAPVFSRVMGDALRLLDVVPDKLMAKQTIQQQGRKSA
jgi:cell division protein FtsI (penicillin-binding protein 3)